MVTLTDNDHYYYTNGYGQRKIGWAGNNYYTNQLNQTRVVWINREARPANQFQKNTFNIEELSSEQLAAYQKGSMEKTGVIIGAIFVVICIAGGLGQRKRRMKNRFDKFENI